MSHKRLLVFILACELCMVACNSARDRAEDELRQIEQDFCTLAAKKSIKEAFLFYAHDSAVIERSGLIYKGKPAIAGYFDSQTLHNVELIWKPDFVEASAKGDLGYTYGKFTFRAINASGDSLSTSGYYHTVWKKLPDGSWKFVWD